MEFTEEGKVLTLSGKLASSRIANATGNATTPITVDGAEAATATSVEANAGTTTPAADSSEALTESAEGAARTTWITERFAGTFARSLRFPHAIDVTAVKARFAEGVLTLTAPKLSKDSSRRDVVIE